MLIKRLIHWIMLLFILSSSQVYSNEATAVDSGADAVVLSKIIQPQTTAPASEQTATASAARTVENDLKEGETRGLPTLNQPIIDQANLLTAAEKQQISQSIIQLNNEGKAQIGVIIVPTTGQEDIFGFAMRVAEAWQLGSAKRDNGLLMAIAVNDRRIQILTGYGLEGVMPDIITSRIINQHITPYFKQNRYAEGIASGIGQVQAILNQDPEIAAQAAQERQQQALHEQQARESTMMTALFILVAGVIASYIVGRRLSASTAAVAGLVAGLVNGAGLITSLLLAGGIFVLLISSIAQLVLQMFLSGGGRGGGGGFGGGGYRGGGGGFGGGGASGSW